MGMDGVDVSMMGERERDIAQEERKDQINEEWKEEWKEERRERQDAGARSGYDGRLGLGPGVGEEEEAEHGYLSYTSAAATTTNMPHPHPYHNYHNTMNTANNNSITNSNLFSTLHHQPKQPPPVPSSDLDAPLIPQQQGT